MKIINKNLNFNSNFRKGNEPEFLVLHHTAISEYSIEDINTLHKGNGWAGCGYHYYIRKNGDIYRGRNDDMIGAHCKNHNINSLGICCEGDFMKEQPTGEQLRKLKELCLVLMAKYKIKTIYGHRELCPTECPGDHFPLDEIRKALTK